MGHERGIRIWYKNDEAVKKVKKEATVRDLYTAINHSLKASDLIDLENYMRLLMEYINCDYCTINLSYARVSFKLIEKKENKFKSLYEVEILDKFICKTYVTETIRFDKLYRMIISVIKTINSNK